jgi:SRSO17 transposase
VAALDKEAADLIDDRGTLPDKARADAVERQQIALLGRLDGNEVHGRSLHRLGDGFGIAIVIMVISLCH